MKRVSGATIKALGTEIAPSDAKSSEVSAELTRVAQSFIILQQARHDADYNLEKPLDRDDAIELVDQANSAFASWEMTCDSDVAKEFLFSLLFKDKERS